MKKKPKKKIKLHPVTQYATDIKTGLVPANRWVQLACARHLQDLKTGKKRGLYFDEAAADHAIAFFPEFLCFYEGDFDGQPFYLTPNQQFIIGSIFGWKRKSDGFRRFRTAYIEQAKGNGKSPIAGGIGLYCIAFDDEPGAEIYAAAVTREQAGILFRDARTFAEKSDSLREMLKIDKHNIAFESENSFFRPISSEKRGLDGKRPHVALIDEIHEHPDDTVVRKMSAGTKTRRQALTFEITNAGYDRHSICFQHHEYTGKILEGIIQDDAWFGMMTGLDVCKKCEAEGKTIPQDGCPDCDDWRDPATWEKANPNMHYLGKPFIDYLKRQVEQGISMPSQENIVKRLNFCIWTESITKWIPTDKWNACAFTVDPEALKGRTCYGGLDLSSNQDLTAWVLVFPPIDGSIFKCVNCGKQYSEDELSEKDYIETFEDEPGFHSCPKCYTPNDDDIDFHKIRLIPYGKYEVLCRFFLPEDNMMERVTRDRIPYDVWARQGFIFLTPGSIIDYDYVISQITKDAIDYSIQDLAFDRWGSQKIITDLQKVGFNLEEGHGQVLVQFGQGYASMAAPTKALEKMVLAHEIAHNGDPVLTWMISNVAIQQDAAGNMKVAKDKSSEKVDGVVALIMGLDRALKNAQTVSIYSGLTVDQIKERMML